jgi:pimeloyl-ACP methyl ester carboxylesterase
VIAAANPLRGLAADAAAVADIVRAVDGPVVLVAHSYGGAVISNVPADAGEIVGLVYACGFAPEPGESAFSLASMFPGSTLGDALRPAPRSDGTTDLYITTERFHEQF